MESQEAPKQYTPTEITPSEEAGVLYVKWQDGHWSALPYSYLRGACPCATCKGRHQPVNIAEVMPVEGVSLVDMLSQGNYALRLLWSDAHQTGIYSYEYLRGLCRCQKCVLRACP